MRICISKSEDRNAINNRWGYGWHEETGRKERESLMACKKGVFKREKNVERMKKKIEGGNIIKKKKKRIPEDIPALSNRAATLPSIGILIDATWRL